MASSGLQLRAVSPRAGGEVPASRPSPAYVSATRSEEYLDVSPSRSQRREEPRGRRSNPPDRSQRPSTDEITKWLQDDREKILEQAHLEHLRREYKKIPLERRREDSDLATAKEELEHLRRQVRNRSVRRLSASSDSSAFSDLSDDAVPATEFSSNVRYVEMDPSPGPPTGDSGRRLPGTSRASIQMQPKLALFARGDKGLLGPSESESTISTTISRDNTAGEHARHSSLFADYGRKLKPKGQPGALRRQQPPAFPTPKFGPNTSEDMVVDGSRNNRVSWGDNLVGQKIIPPDRSPSPAWKGEGVTWGGDDPNDSTLQDKINSATAYIYKSRKLSLPAYAADRRSVPTPPPAR